MSCVALGKLLHLSESQFLRQNTGIGLELTCRGATRREGWPVPRGSTISEVYMVINVQSTQQAPFSSCTLPR